MSLAEKRPASEMRTPAPPRGESMEGAPSTAQLVSEARRKAHGAWLSIFRDLASELYPALHALGRDVPCDVNGRPTLVRLTRESAQWGDAHVEGHADDRDGIDLLRMVKGMTARQAAEMVTRWIAEHSVSNNLKRRAA